MCRTSDLSASSEVCRALIPNTSQLDFPGRSAGFWVSAADAEPKAAAAPKAKAKAKKKKAPALPLPEQMEKEIIPELTKSLLAEEVEELELVFEDNQLRGSFTTGDMPVNFWAFFPDGTLLGQRGWSCSTFGCPPSTVEPFIVDEKRIDTNIVVFWVTKRLMAQKSNLPNSEKA
ncbi:hypothetical protein CYMTET_55565 [Cymbomonas tetramitiformis]|uniref:Uncharacterized protein n=1 Tax=Cymbomonas tetramitiformis TaxID=36881 RepID=A0AAE0EN83_9CHLO|nr:hypothetical protein CYMTET_55565 [Cymbomonas tetramitiformis]